MKPINLFRIRRRLTLFSVILVVLFGVSPPVHATSKLPVNGAQTHGTNGLIIGPDGELYAASAVGSQIVKMNLQNANIDGTLGISDGVVTPDDLRFGPDGSLYWVSILTGNVVRRTATGALTQQFVGKGVDGFTFSSNGKRLFTALDFFGDALYEIDPALSAPPRLIASNWGFLNGMDWGSDGRLYAPVWTQHKIISINVDSCTNAVNPYTECDVRTVADGFGIPASVKFDAQGRLTAVDHMTGDVVRIDVATGNKQVIATLPPGLDNLVPDSAGNLYVSSAEDGFVDKIDPSGKVTPFLKSGIVLPAGVAVVGGALYVADGFVLRKFDATTGALLDQDRTFLAFTALQPPATVAVDGSALLLTSWLGNAVQVWDPTTKTVLQSFTNFASPVNAIMFQGNIVVAELGSTPGAGDVVSQTSNGRVTLASVAVPSGLAASGGDLYAADFANGTLLQLVAGGVTLSTPKTVASGLNQPKGLAVDNTGGVLVCETGTRRLLRVDPSTGNISVVASGLMVGLQAPPGAAPAPPTFAMSSVAVSSSGTMYASGDLGNLIYQQ